MTLCSPEMVLALTQALWAVALRAPASPSGLYVRMKSPRPGDVVVELTGFSTPAIHRIGVFVRRVREPQKRWDVERYGPNLGEVVWYIQADSGERRWTNAMFIAVPPMDPARAQAEGWPP